MYLSKHFDAKIIIDVWYLIYSFFAGCAARCAGTLHFFMIFLSGFNHFQHYSSGAVLFPVIFQILTLDVIRVVLCKSVLSVF